jgi:hypothetical protein
MRLLVTTVAIFVAATGAVSADGMSKANVSAAKAGLPAPQPSVAVSMERGVRVWRPVIDAYVAGDRTSYPVYSAPVGDAGQGAAYGAYGYGGAYGLSGGFGTNKAGSGKRSERLNGSGFSSVMPGQVSHGARPIGMGPRGKVNVHQMAPVRPMIHARAGDAMARPAIAAPRPMNVASPARMGHSMGRPMGLGGARGGGYGGGYGGGHGGAKAHGGHGGGHR